MGYKADKVRARLELQQGQPELRQIEVVALAAIEGGKHGNRKGTKRRLALGLLLAAVMVSEEEDETT